MGGIVVSGSQPAAKRGFARFWRTLRQIFHEVVGGVFAVLALVWVQSAIRAWTRDVAHWLVFAAIGVAAAMSIFAWTSFRRSRQIR
jgi:hypothetical protein